MKKTALMFAVALASALALSACTEKPQTASTRKADAKASDGPGTAYTAAGWKPGDAASWEQQMRVRAQGQNEYVRGGPQ